jgi:hypothetical protein
LVSAACLHEEVTLFLSYRKIGDPGSNLRLTDRKQGCIGFLQEGIGTK